MTGRATTTAEVLEQRLGVWLRNRNWKDCEGLWLRDHGALLAVFEGGDELICGDDCWRWRVFADPRYCTGWAKEYRSGRHVGAPAQHVDPPRPDLTRPTTHGVLLRLAVLHGVLDGATLRLRATKVTHDTPRDVTARVTAARLPGGRWSGGGDPLGEMLARLLLVNGGL